MLLNGFENEIGGEHVREMSDKLRKIPSSIHSHII